MKWSLRYLGRISLRSWGRCLLSILLAALLFFALGQLTALRAVYARLYQDVKVEAIFYGGLPYTTALKIGDSEYVSDPYFEYVTKDCDAEFQAADIVFTNRLDVSVTASIKWLEGWDAESAMSSDSKICIMSQNHAAQLGLALGDTVRVHEQTYLSQLCNEMGLTREEDWDKLIAMRDKSRPNLRIVGLIESESTEAILYVPAASWTSYTWLFRSLALDIATYSLRDYHQSEAFTEYANDVLSSVENPVKMEMDTSNADRIYRIHRLIETLYPLSIAAALLLGGILPGLTVLHFSRDISILRALGAKKRRTMCIYVLGQTLPALLGLLIGLCAILLTRELEFAAIWQSLLGFSAAYLAVCVLGSGIFAFLSVRKDILALLQARE